MRIGIIQNRIGVGGRNVVVAEFIRFCNERGAVPHLLTLSSAADRECFKREYGKNLSFRKKTLGRFPFVRGNAYQTPLTNVLARRCLNQFDVVFNSGRCPYFLPEGPVYIHYVHFPVEASLINEEHFQSMAGFIYTFPLKILYAGRAASVQDGIFLANSQFTEKAIRSTYPALDPKKIRVIYPPCGLNGKKNNSRKELDFVSLGSFIYDKRQMEQLSIAKALPRHDFTLIGNLRSIGYYRKCVAFIRENGMNNVRLYPGATREVVESSLFKARIYLHNKRNEHFGISTVEAIDHGCIPVVHDSGGSREIVPFKRLRFATTEEAVEKCREILNLSRTKRIEVLECLRDHVRQFASEKFRSAMKDLLPVSNV